MAHSCSHLSHTSAIIPEISLEVHDRTPFLDSWSTRKPLWHTPYTYFLRTWRWAKNGSMELHRKPHSRMASPVIARTLFSLSLMLIPSLESFFSKCGTTAMDGQTTGSVPNAHVVWHPVRSRALIDGHCLQYRCPDCIHTRGLSLFRANDCMQNFLHGETAFLEERFRFGYAGVCGG